MPYISRDKSGRITGVSDHPAGEAGEEMAPDHPELLRFLADQGMSSPSALRQLLAESDLRMVRLVDDLVDLLIDKGVITFTDLPEAAGEKYLQRQTARKRLQAVADLMVGEKDII
jgi:hypothetical protein